MNRVLFLLLILSTEIAIAQGTLNIYVEDIPPSHLGEDIYLSGNFNNWQPDDQSLKLIRNEKGVYQLSVAYTHIPGDRIEFKFTRGTWQQSESTADGKLTGPRIADLQKEVNLYCKIEGWRDDFPASTASENVHVLKDSFYMPQLKDYRKIWIYLPKEYPHTQKSYPVVYMQDGQHLFDEATSRGRIGPIEWAVDETLDQYKEPGIIVAIDHHPDMEKRIPEFYYHANTAYPEPKGKAYLAFIVETLKPYVDKHYRTLRAKEYTGIAGSSLGGLISLYAALEYPDTFGWAGIFSPSIWLDYGHIEKEIAQVTKLESIAEQHYFFYSGSNENREKKDGSFVKMTDDVNRIIALLKKRVDPQIEHMINPYGRHGALYWREAFPVFYHGFIQGIGKKEKMKP